MSLGALSLVLHAHLPYIRHPEHPDFLEEDWLFEAIAETYVPLLRMMDRLEADAVPFQLTMSITPPLAEMLADPLLQQRAARRLRKLVALATEVADREVCGPRGRAADHALAELVSVSQHFEHEWGCALLPRFRHHAERGQLELITCTATHGLLPLMATDAARHAQVELACRTHARHFGRRPTGIWLAECAWAPGVDAHLEAAGIAWCCLEDRALHQASPPAQLGTTRPVMTPAGVAAFGRDAESSRQVWSADEGYPGDPAYREFYRDVAWDLPLETVRPYLHDDGVRRALGIKLHRITGKVGLDDKEPYDPDAAAARAEVHARHFLAARRAQLARLREQTGRAAHLLAPYDAELYGHWWAEGPQFLEALLRAAAEQTDVTLVHPSAWLAQEPINQVTVPARSTWGADSTYEVWINGRNSWIYRHLHQAELRLSGLVQRFGEDDDPDVMRALRQAARELLLAQSSDWAFILTMDTSVGYAERRTREHVFALTRLADELESGQLDLSHLAEREGRWQIFADVDPMLWHPSRVVSRGGTAVYRSSGSEGGEKRATVSA